MKKTLSLFLLTLTFVGLFVFVGFLFNKKIKPITFKNIDLDYAYIDLTPNNIKKNESKGENRCRVFLEKYFNKPFTKERPDFLKNVITGSNLELDCFNKELGLAVEYNGKQHYEYTPHFHKTKDSFLNQKYRDNLKRQLCIKNNIVLIEVDYKTKNIESFLKTKLDGLF